MNTSLSPSTLQWARSASALSPAELADALGATLEQVEHWEATGEIDIDFVQPLAEKTKIAFGYLFLPEPPENKLPIADLRRVGSEEPQPPSRRLLSVIYRNQRRQQWYREYLMAHGADPLPFVASATIRAQVSAVAKSIVDTVHIGEKYNRSEDNWENTMARSVENIEAAGIIVSKVSYSDDYTHNALSVKEFRGFALSDPYAPLVFVNAADAPPAQMFTLAHEIAHIWIGESAVSNLEKTYAGVNEIERFCNAVAAEVLVPLERLRADWNTNRATASEVSRLSKEYRVSKIVVARRGRDAGLVSQVFYDKLHAAQIAAATSRQVSGGDYYATKPYEASRLLSAAIITETRGGRIPYREAMALLGIKSSETLHRYAEKLQISL